MIIKENIPIGAGLLMSDNEPIAICDGGVMEQEYFIPDRFVYEFIPASHIKEEMKMRKEKFIRLDVKDSFDEKSGTTKPYYSIMYEDENGELHTGYSSYSLDIISAYLKAYFGVNDNLNETVLYHCTTPKKAKKYYETGAILKPVRGFTTLQAAMAWCIHTGRTVIYEIKGGPAYKLPDHHNKFGEAWWIDEDIPIDRIKAVRFDLPLHKCGEVKEED